MNPILYNTIFCLAAFAITYLMIYSRIREYFIKIRNTYGFNTSFNLFFAVTTVSVIGLTSYLNCNYVFEDPQIIRSFILSAMGFGISFFLCFNMCHSFCLEFLNKKDDYSTRKEIHNCYENTTIFSLSWFLAIIVGTAIMFLINSSSNEEKAKQEKYKNVTEEIIKNKDVSFIIPGYTYHLVKDELHPLTFDIKPTPECKETDKEFDPKHLHDHDGQEISSDGIISLDNDYVFSYSVDSKTDDMFYGRIKILEYGYGDDSTRTCYLPLVISTKYMKTMLSYGGSMTLVGKN